MSPSQAALAGLGLGVVPTDRRDFAPAREISVARKKGARRAAAVLVEVALTLGAVIGVGVAGVTVMAARSGMQPLVVRSGSMEPTIATGSMILVKRIEAPEIRVGDILAVERSDHTRVTHRVVAVQPRGEAAELTMKGDANEDADPIPVTVRHAYRLVWQVPTVGRTIAWLATAQGGFVMGCIATVFLLRTTRRRARGRRT